MEGFALRNPTPQDLPRRDAPPCADCGRPLRGRTQVAVGRHPGCVAAGRRRAEVARRRHGFDLVVPCRVGRLRVWLRRTVERRWCFSLTLDGEEIAMGMYELGIREATRAAIEAIDHLDDATVAALARREIGLDEVAEYLRVTVNRAEVGAEFPERIICRRAGGTAVVEGLEERVAAHGFGFEWNYGGSGPANFALNLILARTDDLAFAWAAHQRFKWDTIVPLPREGGEIARADVDAWLDANRDDFLPQAVATRIAAAQERWAKLAEAAEGES